LLTIGLRLVQGWEIFKRLLRNIRSLLRLAKSQILRKWRWQNT